MGMKDEKRRLDKLEAEAGSGGHTLTIRYENDWRDPPTEPVVRHVPGLKEDVVITVVYVEDWNER